jgi:hypothetical protein
MEPEGSRIQTTPCWSYPHPDEPSPHLHILFILTLSLILSSHLRLGFARDLSSLPTKILYIVLIPHACYMPSSSHPPLFDGSNTSTWQNVQDMKLLIVQFSSASCYLILGPNSLLSTMLCNTVNVRSSLSVADQVSCPQNTKGRRNLWFC